MAYTIIPRHGTIEAFSTLNRVYSDGELLLEEQLDGTYKAKVGDGTTQYNTLPYMIGGDGGATAEDVFGTIAVSGQSDIVADTPTATLTVSSSNGIAITTNAATDTLTLANTFGSTAGTVCQGNDSRLFVVTPQQFGALGDGAADDTTAIQNALNTGKHVRIPKGTYRVTTGLVINQQTGQQIRGDGVLATLIKWEGTTGNCFTFQTSSHCALRDLVIQQVGTPSSGYGVAFIKTGSVGCFRCFADGLRIEGTAGGIDVSRSTETRIRDCDIRNIVGTIGIYYHGTGAGADSCYRLIVEDVVCDNPLGNTSATWIVMDSYAYSLVVNKAALLTAGTGICMSDSANTGSSYPIWAFCWDVECDHNNSTGILLDRGEGFYLNGSWVGSCITGNGISVTSTFRGEVFIGSGTRVYGNAQHGILFNAGPVDIMINGVYASDNSTSSAGSYHGITVGVNASRFSIIGCRAGDGVGVAGNSQGFGIYVSTGTSDHYVIQGNMCGGNITGGISDNGSGGNKSLLGNIV